MEQLPITEQKAVIDQVKTGAEIRRRREAAGMTMLQVGEKVGLSVSAISLLENARRDWTEELVAKVVAAIDGK